jgi:2-polyprenyl-6-methoxyphenol hydroxylase-like FAD-dependent oxidoreductase
LRIVYSLSSDALEEASVLYATIRMELQERSMPECNFDVVIVGGRVAGAGLAIHLAQAGRKVAVLDRASFPSGTTSTHVIYPKTIANLDRLGVLDGILAHHPPPLYTAWYHENRMFVAPHSMEEGRDWAICVRRVTLDAHLLNRAKESGVAVQEKTVVTDLIGAGTDKDPVRGVKAIYQGENTLFEAPLVVGADGVNSTVARLVGAQKQRVMPTRTMLYYAYWTNVDTRNTQDFFFEPPWICAHFLSRSIKSCEAAPIQRRLYVARVDSRVGHVTRTIESWTTPMRLSRRSKQPLVSSMKRRS